MFLSKSNSLFYGKSRISSSKFRRNYSRHISYFGAETFKIDFGTHVPLHMELYEGQRSSSDPLSSVTTFLRTVTIELFSLLFSSICLDR